jgi:hypothetical protein
MGARGWNTLMPEGGRFEMPRIQQLTRPFGFEKVGKLIEQTLAPKKKGGDGHIAPLCSPRMRGSLSEKKAAFGFYPQPKR